MRPVRANISLASPPPLARLSGSYGRSGGAPTRLRRVLARPQDLFRCSQGSILEILWSRCTKAPSPSRGSTTSARPGLASARRLRTRNAEGPPHEGRPFGWMRGDAADQVWMPCAREGRSPLAIAAGTSVRRAPACRRPFGAPSRDVGASERWLPQDLSSFHGRYTAPLEFIAHHIGLAYALPLSLGGFRPCALAEPQPGAAAVRRWTLHALTSTTTLTTL